MDTTTPPKYRQAFEQQLAEARITHARVLLIGDSIAYAWRGSVSADLGTSVFTLAIPFDKTGNALYRIHEAHLPAFLQVVILIGSNNLGEPECQVRNGVLAVVQAVRAKLPQAAVHVVSILPRRGVAPRRIQDINASLGSIIDAFTPFLQSAALLADGVHPSRDGYRLLGELLRPYVSQ